VHPEKFLRIGPGFPQTALGELIYSASRGPTAKWRGKERGEFVLCPRKEKKRKDGAYASLSPEFRTKLEMKIPEFV